MGEISKTDLKKILLQLECHFTWTLLKEDVDLDELEERRLQHNEFKLKVQNCNLLAFVDYLNGKKEDALENLAKAEEAVNAEYAEDIEKHRLVTWGNYAWLYYHMDKVAEAQIYINKVESLCKQYKSTSPYSMRLPHIYFEKAWALLKFGGNYFEKAKENFAKALEEEPNNPEFNAWYAIAMYRLEQEVEEKSAAEGSSLEYLRQALSLNPDDDLILPLLGIKLQDTHNTEEGEKYIEEALAKYPDSPYVLRYAGKFYRRKRETERALNYLTRALSLRPNAAFLYHQIGLCHKAAYLDMKQKNGLFCPPTERMIDAIKLSIENIQKAVERKPKFFFAHLDLANMYIEGKQFGKADEIFQRLFENKMTSKEKQKLHLAFGCFQHYQRKSDSEAMKHYLEALKIDHESYAGKKCKGYLKKLTEQRIKKRMADGKTFATLGFIHQLNKEKKRAIECYEQALAMEPGNEEYLSAIFDLRLSLQK